MFSFSGKPEEDDIPSSPVDQVGGVVPQSSVTTFDNFLSNLSNCINRQLIDNAATQFITNFNNKGNRKKLITTLLRVPRNRCQLLPHLHVLAPVLIPLTAFSRLDLLPFYARLIGILDPCIPDIGQEIVHSLEKEFYHHVS